jgi:heterodisulfide reductase subunit C
MKRECAFTRKVATEIPAIYRCYQCLTCTLGCPLAFAMDLYPHEIVKYVQLGAEDKVLRSSALWTCASCEACATRCPNEIELVKLMDLLRMMAVKKGMVQKQGAIVNDVFLDEIRKRGRVHELSLILDLKRKTGKLFRLDKDEIELGLKMFRHGKLKLFPTKIKGISAIRRLFSRLERAT